MALSGEGMGNEALTELIVVEVGRRADYTYMCVCDIRV